MLVRGIMKIALANNSAEALNIPINPMLTGSEVVQPKALTIIGNIEHPTAA